MRFRFLVITLFASALPLSAQELARVEATATLRIPEFMIVERDAVVEETHAEGMHVRRVTLLVSANRSWRLEIERLCASACAVMRYKACHAEGRAAHREKIVVEFAWRDSERAPSNEEFEFLLVGD